MTTPNTIDHAQRDRELEEAIAAILAAEDDGSPECDVPDGVPLSDAPDHTQATFLKKPTTK